jgi:sugar phosphate isomerase/epimerase
MLVRPELHLTYCTNIHPAEGWDAVMANLRRITPALKTRLSPSAPFAVGLRLSAREAAELVEGHRLADLRAFLDGEGLYVALLNGFPYGPFHGASVKTNVYAPDWRHDARVAYTLNLIAILERLLPGGLDGGISTVPFSYKPWMPVPSREDCETIARNVARIAEALVRVRERSGLLIHLDVEPEPDCLVERTDETVDFFTRWIRPIGAAYLSAHLGRSDAEGMTAMREHVQVCLDCCHLAVEYEDPAAALARLHEADIKVGRMQLSSALHVDLPGASRLESVADRLRPFAESTYLHQVVEKRDGDLRRFPDLDVALENITSDRSARAWRVHFHVPLFIAEYAGLGSTQAYVSTMLGLLSRRPFTRHLEIETYTWDVLPPALKLEIGDSIAREYDWVLTQLKDVVSPR